MIALWDRRVRRTTKLHCDRHSATHTVSRDCRDRHVCSVIPINQNRQPKYDDDLNQIETKLMRGRARGRAYGPPKGESDHLKGTRLVTESIAR